MDFAEQSVVGFLTSDADDIWTEIKTYEEKGISVTDALISILQDTGESAPDKRAHLLKRIRAAYGLGKIRDPRGIPVLINALREQNESLGLVATSALVAYGSDAVGPLISSLSYSEPHFRFYVIQALSDLKDNRAVAPLIPLLRDPQISWLAASALGALGDPQAVGPLIDALRTHKPSECRPFVVALGEIGDIRAVPPLIECLSDFPEWVSVSAAEALAAIGDQAKEFLVDCLNNQDDNNVRERAAIALGLTGSSDGVEVLKVALRASPSAAIRLAAASALGTIRDSSAIEPLTSAVEDPAAGVVKEAIIAIKRIGVSTEDTCRALISVLKKRDPFIVMEGIFALAKIGDKHAIPELERIIHEDNKRVVFHTPAVKGSLGEMAKYAIKQIDSRLESS
jgi:HEAT repeat protein